MERRETGEREPVFDLPGVLVALVAGLVAVHVLRGFLSAMDDLLLTATFAFIPDRFVTVEAGGAPAYPGGWGAMGWSFVTYAALHGSWMHLLVNAVMLAAAGKPVANRFGARRFLVFAAAAAAAGAAAHLAVEPGSPVPMIGASGVVFGVLGAVLRFGFVPAWMPVPPALTALSLPRVRGFILALVVMTVILVVVGTAPFDGDDGTVAWGAHLGGFLLGFFGFRLFEPAPRN